jgi:hypothetical protein
MNNSIKSGKMESVRPLYKYIEGERSYSAALFLCTGRHIWWIEQRITGRTAIAGGGTRRRPRQT